jgi:thymidylate kinase
VSADSSELSPDFWVLLGTDYAGKSSVMAALAGSRFPWRLISTDETLLQPRHSLIGRLRRLLLRDVLAPADGAYSADFMVTLLQTAVVHLRDQIADDNREQVALVDSYYYKILAKCRLTGVGDHPMFSWWRSFPQPRGVVYLDVEPETAWLRSRSGRSANRFEHYGDKAGRRQFDSFQADLRRELRAEVGHLPVIEITQQGTVADTANTIRKVLLREHG